MYDFNGKDSVNILVKTNAKKTRIIKYDEQFNLYFVEVSEVPENNKANIKIINYFSKITKKKVKIIKGLKNNKKTLKFE
jgi:uncharacterized protein (TIGR00251 family)